MVDGKEMKEQKKVSKVIVNGHFRSSDLTVNIHVSTKICVTGNNLVLHKTMMEGHSIEKYKHFEIMTSKDGSLFTTQAFQMHQFYILRNCLFLFRTEYLCNIVE